jgi:hypothetical protein
MEEYFVAKKQYKRESRTDKEYNPEEERQRLKETRIAQIGAAVMITGVCHSDYRQYFLSIDMIFPLKIKIDIYKLL